MMPHKASDLQFDSHEYKQFFGVTLTGENPSFVRPKNLVALHDVPKI
jgi:hypothetical protein